MDWSVLETQLPNHLLNGVFAPYETLIVHGAYGFACAVVPLGS